MWCDGRPGFSKKGTCTHTLEQECAPSEELCNSEGGLREAYDLQMNGAVECKICLNLMQFSVMFRILFATFANLRRGLCLCNKSLGGMARTSNMFAHVLVCVHASISEASTKLEYWRQVSVKSIRCLPLVEIRHLVHPTSAQAESEHALCRWCNSAKAAVNLN